MTNINATVCGLLTEDEQSVVRLYFKLCDMYDIAYAEGAMTKRIEQQPDVEHNLHIESATGDPFDAESVVEVDTRKRGPYKTRILKESLSADDETEAGPLDGGDDYNAEQRDKVRKAVDIMCDKHRLPRSIRRQAMKYPTARSAQGYLSIEVRKRNLREAAMPVTARGFSLSESED